ncbi:MAG: amino acid adenylation domain-containing protein, partial [Candidatus Rokuibacteriota bacterium]
MDRAQPAAEPATRSEVFPRAALGRSIPERFEEIARRHAHRPAVRRGEERITYGALDRAASRAAAGIRARGDAAGTPIALLLERDIPQVVATLAVLKAGGIYVPLDAAFPEDRLRAAVEDARPAALIVDAATAGLAARLAPSSLPVLQLSELDGEPVAAPPAPVAALASITYTSGSTGAPKGIVQSHENLLHDVLVRANYLQLHPADRVGGVSSLAFSAGAKSVLLALLNGATFCMFDTRRDGLHVLAPWLAREGVTILDSVASAFRHFAGALEGRERFPALRMIWTSSEHVTAHDVRLYHRHFPRETAMVIRYSASEAGVICQLRVDRESPVGDDFSDVGYPVPDKELLLLDDAGRPVPAGEVGEIVIRSRYLAVGYWRQPELTARAFAPDPGGGPARLYRTGDLGRLRPDGCLQHLGRKDFQAKVRGQRVDLGVLEQALLAVPGVKEAAVVVREDRPGDQRLVGYVVPEPGADLGEAVLRTTLGARFPGGPVPAAYMRLSGLPRTPTGKVDLRGLPMPGGDRAGVHVDAARDATEARLIELWEEILDVRPIGVRDNFFALGGHSLLAARLLAEIAGRFERRLPMATIFRAPTVDRLAAVLRGERPPDGESSLVPIARGESGALPIFCVHEHTGELFCYLALARHLGPDHPVWGLVPRGLDGRAAPLRTMAALGAAYVDEIRRVQPHGPYALVGYCFGGIVAF